MIIKAYLHSTKDEMYWAGKDAGLSKEALENFKHALYEVEFDLEVDDEGNSVIMKVDGRKLEQ